jgi:hypothetical protein
MSGQGTLATTLITTKGLFTSASIGSGTVLTFGAGFTPLFGVYITEVPPAPPPPPPKTTYFGSGGSRPYAPGEFAKSWKYINPTTGLTSSELWPVIPLDQEANFFRRKKLFTVKMQFGEKKIEKIFPISEKRAKTIIEVINVVNASKQRVSASVSGVKKRTTAAMVKIGNVFVRNKRTK